MRCGACWCCWCWPCWPCWSGWLVCTKRRRCKAGSTGRRRKPSPSCGPHSRAICKACKPCSTASPHPIHGAWTAPLFCTNTVKSCGWNGAMQPCKCARRWTRRTKPRCLTIWAGATPSPKFYWPATRPSASAARPTPAATLCRLPTGWGCKSLSCAYRCKAAANPMVFWSPPILCKNCWTPFQPTKPPATTK